MDEKKKKNRKNTNFRACVMLIVVDHTVTEQQ
jgi:hypothetical protein